MIKVKIFMGDYPELLETKINNFIKDDPTIKIVDMKFSAFFDGSFGTNYLYALMMFTTEK